MGSNAEQPRNPWVSTPCIRSAALSREAGCNIYLKLETLQPSGSFKSRGIGTLMSRALLSSPTPSKVRFYCSSGGNAGLACATAAISLQQPATIVVPFSTTELMVSKLKTLGVEVVQRGLHWSEADTYLREELLSKDKEGVYVPPFDHADIWAGNGTMIDEIEETFAERGESYDAIVCSVGGGGLFCGIMDGLSRHGRLGDGGGVKVMAMETAGADSLSYSLKQKKLSRLPAITSIATSLGATQVAAKAYQWGQRPEVTSCVFSDAEAAMGSVCFADDERILVEAACGVSIAPAYNGTLRTLLFPELSDEEFERLNVVLVVCGGSNVTLQILEGYRQKYGKDETVVRKFHRRRADAKGGRDAKGVMGEKMSGVPFILHDKTQHVPSVVGNPSCCEKEDVISRPSVGAMDEEEVAVHGKVVKSQKGS